MRFFKGELSKNLFCEFPVRYGRGTCESGDGCGDKIGRQECGSENGSVSSLAQKRNWLIVNLFTLLGGVTLLLLMWRIW